MTLNHKNTPNCRLIALAWARIKAEGGGGDCTISAENRKEIQVNEIEYQENPHPDHSLDGIPDDALCGLRGRQGLE